MAAVAVLRAFGARGPMCLPRGPWAQLSARFCSRDPAGAGRRESEPRPTSARQLDGIRNIVLSNPKKRNALSLAMLKSLQSDILHDADSNDLKVIIISAEGPVFSSGHDLKELTEEQGRDYHAEVFQTCSKVALEMLFTGEPISAQQALLHGLLSKVVPEAELQEETMRIARKIASLSRPVVSLGKATFYRQLPQDLGTAYYLTSRAMVDNLALRDGQEGITAFLQKRKPIWSHEPA
ncbi:enoyl-CoA hydratase domain-containing protein 3, mitochondrial isoform X2 [Macaca fascicularis]|uniref:enoyl-CoA hydratase domain-containing protein 3, mitochondrial isoform X2 n=1 Tax=Macaca fascicularis TaxID=9541 RepID=UPI003D15905A